MEMNDYSSVPPTAASSLDGKAAFADAVQRAKQVNKGEILV